MLLVGLIIGLLVGVVLNWAADYLPRFRVRAGSTKLAKPSFNLALWRLMTARSARPQSLWIGAAVELITAALFAYLSARFGLSPPLFLFALLAALFILIALIDLKYRLVLNVLVFPAIAVVLIAAFVIPDLDIRRVLLGGAFGFFIFAGVAWLRPGELGWGDVKLATLIGMIFGFPDALWALAIGIFAGGISAIVLIVSRRGTRRSQIPYAPFLCLGALVALLYNPISILTK